MLPKKQLFQSNWYSVDCLYLASSAQLRTDDELTIQYTRSALQCELGYETKRALQALFAEFTVQKRLHSALRVVLEF